MKKRILTILLCTIMSFALISCGNNKTENVETKSTKKEDTTNAKQEDTKNNSSDFLNKIKNDYPEVSFDTSALDSSKTIKIILNVSDNKSMTQDECKKKSEEIISKESNLLSSNSIKSVLITIKNSKFQKSNTYEYNKSQVKYEWYGQW